MFDYSINSDDIEVDMELAEKVEESEISFKKLIPDRDDSLDDLANKIYTLVLMPSIEKIQVTNRIEVKFLDDVQAVITIDGASCHREGLVNITREIVEQYAALD